MPQGARAKASERSCTPTSTITHTGRHSVQDEPFELLARQRREVIERSRGRSARRLDDAAQLLTFAIRAP